MSQKPSQWPRSSPTQDRRADQAVVDDSPGPSGASPPWCETLDRIRKEWQALDPDAEPSRRDDVRETRARILSALDELETSVHFVDSEEQSWASDALNLACRIGELHGDARYRIWTRDRLRRGHDSVVGEKIARDRREALLQAERDKLTAFAAGMPNRIARDIAMAYLLATGSLPNNPVQKNAAIKNTRKRFVRAVPSIRKK
jgi:hypothetical protein